MDAVHPDDKERVEAAFGHQLKGEALENEYRILQPDGSVRWIRDRAFPIFDGLGNTIRIAGIAEDITRRKEAEAVLRRSEQRYQRLVE